MKYAVNYYDGNDFKVDLVKLPDNDPAEFIDRMHARFQDRYSVNHMQPVPDDVDVLYVFAYEMATIISLTEPLVEGGFVVVPWKSEQELCA